MSISTRDILTLIIRHGQHLLVYPAAFDPRGRPWYIQNPALHGMAYMAPLVKTSDGVDLSCFLVPQTRESLASGYEVPSFSVTDDRVELTPAAAEALATVIVFHGNCMHNWEDMHSVQYLFRMKCNVFLLSYRGYSFSGGSPSEAGLQKDAQAALDYILAQPYLAHVPIILYGHSLGGGVAISLASRNPSSISALLVSNTFTSIPDIVRSWPIIGLPGSFICSQKWRSIDKMRSIHTDTPILMISGRQDEVIPAQHMDRLWEAAQNRGVPKNSKSWRWPILCSAQDDSEPEPPAPPIHDKFVTIKRGTHNSTTGSRAYWKAMRSFIEMVGEQTKDRPPVVDTESSTAEGIPDRRWRCQDGKLVVVE